MGFHKIPQLHDQWHFFRVWRWVIDMESELSNRWILPGWMPCPEGPNRGEMSWWGVGIRDRYPWFPWSNSYFRLKSMRSFSTTSTCLWVDNSPNSRRINPVVAVIRRWILRVEETRSPVVSKSSSFESSTKSVCSKSVGIWLLINAKITCWCGPMGFVKQTAGRTLAVPLYLLSSNALPSASV